MSETENKKLSELRVVDLRAELEKRGLDRNGVKQVLLERLTKALTDEGLDPETYVFEITDKKRSTQSTEEEKNEKVEEKQPETEKEVEPTEVPKPKVEDTKPIEDTTTDSVKNDTENVTPVTVKKPSEVKPTNTADEENDGHESPIRLTLEDDDETLHDVENETAVDKPTTEKDVDEKTEDKKSNASEATSQSEPKTSEQSTENAAGSGSESKGGEKESKDGYVSGGKQEETKLQKKLGPKSNPNVVWISNVAQNTRASELKAALSACGKVTGAKVVVNARFPGTCCFGYVTMSSIEDVENVIAKLNNTELNGQIIKIDKFDHVRAEQMKQLKAAPNTNKPAQRDDKRPSKSPGQDSLRKDDKSTKSDKSSSDGDKKKEGDVDEKTGSRKSESKSRDGKEGFNSRYSRGRSRADSKNGGKSVKSDDGRVRSTSRTSKERLRTKSRERDRRHIRSNSRGRHEKEVLTFDKIREERERQRLREKERILREEARRRHEEAARQREVERRQRSEAHRLEREKEKLRMEREKIEREKAELVRMERERQRLEREKIALEKLELERTLIRLGEERRAAKRPAPYRREEGFDERKRPTSDRHFDEPPPPPRFDPPPSRPTTGPSGSTGKYEARPYERDSRGEARSEPRGRELPPSRPKDSRYVDRERDRDRSPHFRASVREDRDRRSLPDGKPDLAISSRDHRYGEPNASLGRFDRNTSNWTEPPQKPFNATSTPKPWTTKDPWRPDTSVSDRSNSGPSSSRTSDSRETRNRELPTSRPKETRFGEKSTHSRAVRDERDRRPVVENKTSLPLPSRDLRHGITNVPAVGRSENNSVWSAPLNHKPPAPNLGPNKPWRNNAASERWTFSSQGNSSNRAYPGNPSSNAAPMNHAASGMNRYHDNRHSYNKLNTNSVRKY